MRVAAVAQECNLVAPGHPRRERIAVAYFPVEQGGRLVDGGGDSRVQLGNVLAHVGHVAGLEPRLLDLHVCLVRELAGDDPVEFLAVAEGVLHKVRVVADPAAAASSSAKCSTWEVWGNLVRCEGAHQMLTQSWSTKSLHRASCLRCSPGKYARQHE